MYRYLPLGVLMIGLSGCGPEPDQQQELPPPPQVAVVVSDDSCSDSWYHMVEAKLGSGDGQGHGPDVGSDEWKSVVEFRLGVRGQAAVPARDSQAWCDYVERELEARSSQATVAPSFACDGELGSIPTLVCATPALAQLDLQLAGVYSEALEKAVDEQPPTLKAEQRGWIKGRDECWKESDRPACVQYEYQHRIAELQARYQLVDGRGPVLFECNGDPRNEVIVTFYATEPRTLLAERGDRVSLMFAERSASGSRYQGRNESFWEHQGEAQIVWGLEAEPMLCRPRS